MKKYVYSLLVMLILCVTGCGDKDRVDETEPNDTLAIVDMNATEVPTPTPEAQQESLPMSIIPLPEDTAPTDIPVEPNPTPGVALSEEEGFTKVAPEILDSYEGDKLVVTGNERIDLMLTILYISTAEQYGTEYEVIMQGYNEAYHAYQSHVRIHEDTALNIMVDSNNDVWYDMYPYHEYWDFESTDPAR